MKILLVVALFNVLTHQIHDAKVVPGKEFDTLTECQSVLLDVGPQKPDKNGDVKLYGCAVPKEQNKDNNDEV